MDDEDLCDNMVDLGVHNGHSEDEEWIPDSVKTRRARARGNKKVCKVCLNQNHIH